MTDDDLVTAFEAATLPSLPHRDHVRLAWWYLGQAPLAAAAARFIDALRRYAASLGAADKYHETITWAFLLIIQDRRARAAPNTTWADFAAANADLFAPDVLTRWYTPATLASPLARRSFVFPDRV